MTREVGSYCYINLEKLLEEGCITEKRYQQLKEVKEFADRNTGIQGLSTESVLPLIYEKDLEIKAKAIEAIGKQVKKGNTPTAKQVKQLIENKRKGNDFNRGGENKKTDELTELGKQMQEKATEKKWEAIFVAQYRTAIHNGLPSHRLSVVVEKAVFEVLTPNGGCACTKEMK